MCRTPTSRQVGVSQTWSDALTAPNSRANHAKACRPYSRGYVICWDEEHLQAAQRVNHPRALPFPQQDASDCLRRQSCKPQALMWMLGVPHFSLWVLVLLFPVPHHCSFRSLDYSFSSLSYTRALAVPTHVASRHRLRQYQTEQKRLWHLGIGLDCFKQNKQKTPAPSGHRLRQYQTTHNTPAASGHMFRQHQTKQKRPRHQGIGLYTIKRNKQRLRHLGRGLDNIEQHKKRLRHLGIGLDTIKQNHKRLRHLGIGLDNTKQHK